MWYFPPCSLASRNCFQIICLEEATFFSPYRVGMVTVRRIHTFLTNSFFQQAQITLLLFSSAALWTNSQLF